MVEGLPYNDNTFDLVQQRYRFDIFPEQQFKEKIINDYIRVTKPGGWIEFLVYLLLLISFHHTHIYYVCACYIICIYIIRIVIRNLLILVKVIKKSKKLVSSIIIHNILILYIYLFIFQFTHFIILNFVVNLLHSTCSCK